MKRRVRIALQCKQCGKEFTAKPSQIDIGFGKYCSRKCSQLAMRNGKNMRCGICGTEIYRSIKFLKKSKSKKFFCTKRCQTIWRNQLYVGVKHANWKHGKATYRNALSRDSRPCVCAVCKTADVRVLAVHHIDRNRANNKLNNLAWLCHNCHFLVHHYDVGRDLGLLRPRS